MTFSIPNPWQPSIVTTHINTDDKVVWHSYNDGRPDKPSRATYQRWLDVCKEHHIMLIDYVKVDEGL